MGSLSSLVLYVAAFLFSTLFVYLGYKKKSNKLKFIIGGRRVVINPALIVGVMIPVLLSGFRWNVGTDFPSYIIEYNAAIQSSSYLEISFNVLSNASNYLFGGPVFMLSIFAALTVLPIIWALNKSTLINTRHRWIFWMLFLFIVFPQTFNMLRQGVSVSLGFYLIISVIENKRIFTISNVVCLLLAVSFHASAWLLVPYIVLVRYINNVKKKKLFVFMLISAVIGIFTIISLPYMISSISEYLSHYLGKDIVSRSVLPRSLLIITLVGVCWRFYRTIRIPASYIALMWVGLIMSIGGFFVPYFERAGYYVTLLIPLLVMTKILQYLDVKYPRISKLFVFVFALGYFIGVYYLLGSSDIFPYQLNIS